MNNIRKIILCVILITSTSLSAKPESLLDISLDELLNIETFSYSTSVLDSHLHIKGEWMVGYQMMVMGMNQLRSGTNIISEGNVLNTYMVTPTRMYGTMHMVELMYAFTSSFTTMVMINYVDKSMSHQMRSGTEFTTTSSGVGDLIVMSSYNVIEDRKSREYLILTSGVSFPTGRIDQRDDTPTQTNTRLPYSMQTGSGTFDFLPGITYYRGFNNWVFGLQGKGIFRTGENVNNYNLGNQYILSSWGSWKWADWTSSTAMLRYQNWDKIHGTDAELNPTMVPTADTNNSGGQILELHLSQEFYASGGQFSGQKGGIEFVVPLIQSLSGPSLERSWQLNISWIWTI